MNKSYKFTDPRSSKQTPSTKLKSKQTIPHSIIKLRTTYDKGKVLEIRSKVPGDTTEIVKGSSLWRVGLGDWKERVESADSLHYKTLILLA